MASAFLLFSNNAASTLAGAITSTATTATLAAGTGALFPTISAGEGFFLTFNDAATGLLYEIVFVTGLSGDTITGMARAQDGTAALAWSAGDIAIQLVTAGDMNAMMQIQAAIGRQTGLPMLVTSTTGSLTFPANTNSVLAILVGGGGGSANAPATGAGQASVSSGAGSGCLVEVIATSGFTGSSITIGAGGAIGSSGGNTIWTLTTGPVFTANGGATSVVFGPGTPPGIAVAATTTPASPVSGEYFNTSGQPGQNGFALSTTIGSGGRGGGIPRFGTGGAPGVAGVGYGAGGGGNFAPASSGIVAGAVGYQGCAIFYPMS